jgi:hypothetical protein
MNVPGDVAAAEVVRRAHIGHEASVKSIGALYFIGGLLTGCGALILPFMLVHGPHATAGDGESAFMAILAVIFGVLSILLSTTCFGLYGLRPWARITATILAVIGLLGFPIGTLINAYFLWLLLSAKGSMVFSKEYKEIIALTPHVKYRTSWIVLGVLILLIVGVVVAILAAI